MRVSAASLLSPTTVSMRGVVPHRSWTFKLAPYLARSRTISRLPTRLAQCSGVQPSLWQTKSTTFSSFIVYSPLVFERGKLAATRTSFLLMDAPFFSRTWQMLVRCNVQAQCKAFLPSEPFASTSILLAIPDKISSTLSESNGKQSASNCRCQTTVNNTSRACFRSQCKAVGNLARSFCFLANQCIEEVGVCVCTGCRVKAFALRSGIAATAYVCVDPVLMHVNVLMSIASRHCSS